MHEDELKRRLFDHFCFADRRVKNFDRGRTFLVDDRGPDDHNAYGHRYLSLCMVFAQVNSPDVVEVQLLGNVPVSFDIESWASSVGASLTIGKQSSLVFTVAPNRLQLLDQLANLLEEIVHYDAPRYPVPSWKYACPRTAESLRRLKRVLQHHWMPVG
jgi:hypothetical protein